MHIYLTILQLALLASSLAVSYEDVVREEWEAFKVEHGKFYQSQDDETNRQTIYMKNLRKIYEHNKQYEMGLTSFKLAMNQFGDFTHEEFLQMQTAKLPEQSEDQLNTNDTDLIDISENGNGSLMYDPVEDTIIDVPNLPTSVDWRYSGAVTPVKNQLSCGSCWSFSATGALEGQWHRKTRRLISLSEQNLMDCSWAYGNHGCNGGWMHSAFRYVIHNHGIDTEQSYPYQGHNSHCHYNFRAKGASAYNMVAFSGENNLRIRVATVGPVAFAAEVKGHEFMFYHSGVYDNPSCGRAVNHAMLVVGYGREEGRDYWQVKNSWGDRWGDHGYIKMARNRNSQCAIADYAVYPLV